jgi:hypothetical protein
VDHLHAESVFFERDDGLHERAFVGSAVKRSSAWVVLIGDLLVRRCASASHCAPSLAPG